VYTPQQQGVSGTILSPTPVDYERERHELDALLASGIFNRAPNLAQLLNYICTKYFEGATDQIKEYNVAIEALGRGPEFDQKRDSIVRVEAHRLRKRLREYYETDGASHAVKIIIPPGQYAPKFIRDETLLPAASNGSVVPAKVTEPAAPPATLEFSLTKPHQQHIMRISITVLAVGLVVGVLYWNSQHVAGSASTIPSEPPQPVQTSDDLRILAGATGRDYIDGLGRTWQSDRYFKGGGTFRDANHKVFGTRDSSIYQSRREGDFAYDIPLKPGVYELRLHFAETLFGESNIAGGGESSRIFYLGLNGKPLVPELDVIGETGASAADIKVFKDISPAPDGYLHLKFSPITGSAFLNAIEITPGVAGKMRSIRIVARDRGYTDKNGYSWEPDRYAKGGQLVLRADPVGGATDPELYRGERFGNITYSIPVAPGRYGLVLHFSETWFGPGKPGRGGVGSRIFSILCDGVALVRNFDIFREAGGSDLALTRVFHGLEPNPQGKLVISLVPVRNYACINALEVIDESK
jgi:hypothetical protein